jgi:hypothetical protein
MRVEDGGRDFHHLPPIFTPRIKVVAVEGSRLSGVHFPRLSKFAESLHRTETRGGVGGSVCIYKSGRKREKEESESEEGDQERTIEAIKSI